MESYFDGLTSTQTMPYSLFEQVQSQQVLKRFTNRCLDWRKQAMSVACDITEIMGNNYVDNPTVMTP